MALFVNLPLSYLAARPEALDRLAARGLWPELGLDAASLDSLPERWHADAARRLAAAGLRPGVHLPFYDLRPGSGDACILSASRERLARAATIARIYAPTHMIGHPSLNSPLPPDTHEAMRERCRETWLTLLADWPDHPPLYLENTFDAAPDELAALVADLAPAGCGVCFDVGHWHSFAGGSRRKDLGRWLDRLAPHIGHLHLHDNAGDCDEHLGLGAGKIPFTAFFARLDKLGVKPTATLEPHSEEALDRSLSYLERRPALFRKISG